MTLGNLLHQCYLAFKDKCLWRNPLTYTVILISLVISGCASQGASSRVGSYSPRLNTPIIVQSQDISDKQNEPTKAETLAQGKPTTIKTSNGEIEVTPTVVAPSDNVHKGIQSANSDYYDPLESINRAIFSFNNIAYRYLLIPAAKGYNLVVPNEVKTKVGNVFNNINEPINFLSNLAAFEGQDAGRNLGRFLINSTIGIAGLFDPAATWFDIQKADQSVGDTLTHYNVKSGPYLVLPLLGQSDMRSATSVISEALMNPIRLTVDSPQSTLILGLGTFNSVSSQIGIYTPLYDQAEDPYVYFRNQYIQGRNRDQAFKSADP